MGSRLILSSGFTIRRVCYARAISHRFSKRRRRDREGANSIMVGAYFIGGPRCQGRRRQRRYLTTPFSLSNSASPVAFSSRK
jgi:hypothetical protein